MTFATFLRDSPCEAFRTLYSRVGGDEMPEDLAEAVATLSALGEPTAAFEAASQAWREYRLACGKLPHPLAPGRAGA